MWPKEVRSTKVLLPDGSVAYHLFHDQVDELGRILIQPAGADRSMVTCEVLSHPDGGLEERKRILEPLGQMVSEALSNMGPGFPAN